MRLNLSTLNQALPQDATFSKKHPLDLKTLDLPSAKAIESGDFAVSGRWKTAAKIALFAAGAASVIAATYYLGQRFDSLLPGVRAAENNSLALAAYPPLNHSFKVAENLTLSPNLTNFIPAVVLKPVFSFAENTALAVSNLTNPLSAATSAFVERNLTSVAPSLTSITSLDVFSPILFPTALGTGVNFTDPLSAETCEVVEQNLTSVIPSLTSITSLDVFGSILPPTTLGTGVDLTEPLSAETCGVFSPINSTMSLNDGFCSIPLTPRSGLSVDLENLVVLKNPVVNESERSVEVVDEVANSTFSSLSSLFQEYTPLASTMFSGVKTVAQYTVSTAQYLADSKSMRTLLAVSIYAYAKIHPNSVLNKAHLNNFLNWS